MSTCTEAGELHRWEQEGEEAKANVESLGVKGRNLHLTPQQWKVVEGLGGERGSPRWA